MDICNSDTPNRTKGRPLTEVERSERCNCLRDPPHKECNFCKRVGLTTRSDGQTNAEFLSGWYEKEYNKIQKIVASNLGGLAEGESVAMKLKKFFDADTAYKNRLDEIIKQSNKKNL